MIFKSFLHMMFCTFDLLSFTTGMRTFSWISIRWMTFVFLVYVCFSCTSPIFVKHTKCYTNLDTTWNMLNVVAKTVIRSWATECVDTCIVTSRSSLNLTIWLLFFKNNPLQINTKKIFNHTDVYNLEILFYPCVNILLVYT